MKSISTAELQQLINESRLLEADGFGPKVVESADGKTIHKLFRRKRWFSSALIFPYALRFARNARRLKSQGFATVSVRQVRWCRSLGYHLLSYDRVAGSSLRELIRESARPQFFVELGQMIARLHLQGVYFRSLHLGNLLRDGDNHLVLIDIADMRFFGRPLSASQRLRNFKPLLNRDDDREIISTTNWRTLVKAYAESAGAKESLVVAIRSLGESLPE